MKLRALALCAGIVAILCFACTPPPGPPPPGPPMSITCNRLDAFKAKVSILSLPFSIYGARPVPMAARSIDANSVIAADLWSAFCAAPPFFQRDLLGLDNIFVNPCADVNSCGLAAAPVCDRPDCKLSAAQVAANSWGYREWRSVANAGKRYIAISAGLWQDGQHARPLNDFETGLIKQLLFWPSGPGIPQPQYLPDPSTQNRPDLTVLAALAHELGHVRWYDAFVAVPGGSQDLKRLCGGAFFSSWAANPPAPPSHWRDFGILSTHPHRHGLVQISQIQRAIPADLRAAGMLLDLGVDQGANRFVGIYAPGAPWASYFAALSPDEDFVESYKLFVLTQADPKLSLPIQIPYAGTEDVPTALRRGTKPELKGKISCVAALPPFSAPDGVPGRGATPAR